eukprot:Selendium_serpulae@DN6400_c0_g1_i1.p1
MNSMIRTAFALVAAISIMVTPSVATTNFINTVHWKGEADKKVTIQVEVVLDTDAKGIAFTLEYANLEDTVVESFASHVGLSGNTEFVVHEFTLRNANLLEGGSLLLKNDADKSIMSCVRWGTAVGTEDSQLCSNVITEVDVDTIWRLIQVPGPTTGNIDFVPYRGQVLEDFAGGNGWIAEAVADVGDTRLGKANAGQFFAGVNDAPAFINQVFYKAPCDGNNMTTGIEVAIHGRPTKFVLVANDANGITAYVPIDSLEFQDWDIRYFEVDEFTMHAGQVVHSEFGKDFSSGAAMLIKIMDFEGTVFRSVLSSIAWGSASYEFAIDWAGVDVASITGGQQFPMEPHTYYPLVVRTEPLGVAEEDRLEVDGENMATMQDGSWKSESTGACTLGEFNTKQTGAYVTTTTAAPGSASRTGVTLGVVALIILSYSF